MIIAIVLMQNYAYIPSLPVAIIIKKEVIF